MVKLIRPEHRMFQSLCKYLTTKYEHIHQLEPNSLILLFHRNRSIRGVFIVETPYAEQFGTAKVHIAQAPNKKLMTPETTNIAMDFVFNKLKLRKISTTVPSNHHRMLNLLRKMGWEEIINPKEYSNDIDEHILYYFRHQWKTSVFNKEYRNGRQTKGSKSP